LSQHLERNGFDMRDVAVLAATIEHLVHKEAVEGLQAVSAALGGSGSADQNLLAVDAYMAGYIMGTNFSDFSQATENDVHMLLTKVGSMMPKEWPETQQFVHQFVQKESFMGNLSFAGAVRVVESSSEEYGRWQDHDCMDFKKRLMQVEENGTGRVNIADFYDQALNKGNWEFSESVAYLRDIGALDMTSPTRPRVVIPNYIHSQSNCVAPSEYYSVCCINECDDIHVQLESGLGAPEVTPPEIIDQISRVSSSTVPQGQSVSDVMRNRLKQIANAHAGRVPIFGRLFAEWLHHMYPRECPYPHVSGMRKEMSLQQWEQQNPGLPSRASREEMQQIVASRAAPDSNTPILSAPWTLDEELLEKASPQAKTEYSDPKRSFSQRIVDLLTV